MAIRLPDGTIVSSSPDDPSGITAIPLAEFLTNEACRLKPHETSKREFYTRLKKQIDDSGVSFVLSLAQSVGESYQKISALLSRITGKPKAAKGVNWGQVFYFFAREFGWNAERVGELTFPQIIAYMEAHLSDRQPADDGEKISRKQPDNPDVRDLCHLLAKSQAKIARGEISEIGIARELARNNEKKAKNLLRQARRFKHLWKRADK